MANLPFGSMGIKLSYQAQIALCKKKTSAQCGGLFVLEINFSTLKNSQKIDFVFFAGFYLPQCFEFAKKREGIFPSLKVIAIESYLPQCFMRVSPIAEGVGDTAMPASSRALILSSAEPEFPETIAPA